MKASTFLDPDEDVVGPDTGIDEVRPLLSVKKYVAVKSGSRFVGILTRSDIIRRTGLRVADLLTPKPLVSADTDLGTVIDLMAESDHEVIPFKNSAGDYVGSLSQDDILDIVTGMVRARVEVRVSHFIGPMNFEAARHHFLTEMFHQTKNPIQGILSAVRLIREESSETGRSLMLNSIETQAKQIDSVIEHLYRVGFAAYDGGGDFSRPGASPGRSVPSGSAR